MTTAKTPKAKASENGTDIPTPEQLQELLRREAIEHEEAIREEAAAIWATDENADVELHSHLLRELRPLLRRPIPRGFIEKVGKTEGKPYLSTGVKSVQVQMDRLDNVLGPENWGYEATHTDDGKRCYVKAWIGPDENRPLMKRDSWGGVNRGSTEGNLWKGSFTNAAKPAFARLGPAWEVYVGAADFDPDTDPDAAKEQEKADTAAGVSATPIGKDRGEKLAQIVTEAKLTDTDLKNKLRALGIKSLADATEAQGMAVVEWAAEARRELPAEGGSK